MSKAARDSRFAAFCCADRLVSAPPSVLCLALHPSHPSLRTPFVTMRVLQAVVLIALLVAGAFAQVRLGRTPLSCSPFLFEFSSFQSQHLLNDHRIHLPISF